MRVNGQEYSRVRSQRLLAALQAAEEVLWADAMACSVSEERRRVGEQRNQIVALMRDLEAEIAAEAEEEEVQTVR